MDQQRDTQAVRRRARGVQRIASILNAAETVFTEMGYDEATTNHIAAQAGISPSSLYQFFSNKEEIVQALAAQYTEELQGVYDSVFSIEAASLPLARWLNQIIDGLVTFHLAHPAFLLLFSRNSPLSQFSSLAHALQQEVQTRFAFGFQRRAPLAAKCAGWLCQQLRLPTVLGQLLVGVLIGPSLLGWVHPESILDAFSTIGVIILMFIAGLETDMQEGRASGFSFCIDWRDFTPGRRNAFFPGSRLYSACEPLHWNTPDCYECQYFCSDPERFRQTDYKIRNHYSRGSSD